MPWPAVIHWTLPGLVAHAVPVLHRAVEHVGHRLEPAVRMRREPRQVVVGVVRVDLVEQQERIEQRERARAERAPQPDPRPLDGRLRVDQVGDLARPRRSGRRGLRRVHPTGTQRARRNADRQRLQDVAPGEVVRTARHADKRITRPTGHAASGRAQRATRARASARSEKACRTTATGTRNVGIRLNG